MKKEKHFDYFEAFIKMTETAVESAKLLDHLINNYNSLDLPKVLEDFHEIEHQADEMMHKTINRLAIEFLPPIEREDIVTLVQRLDDIVDNIEDVAMAMYMFNIKEIIPEVLEFTTLIGEGTEILYEVMKEFSTFKKSKDIKDKIISINTVEEKGDDLYMKTLRSMYERENNVKNLMIWTRTIDKFEKTLDSLEETSNIMETIILKNS